MAKQAVDSDIKCGGCRCLLFNTKSHGLLDSHSNPLHTVQVRADSCSSLHERSNLYLDDENLPQFVSDAVNESGFTSGRLKCSKCGTRLGAFNYVKGKPCNCSSHILPPVHLVFSKVDYLGYIQNKASVDVAVAAGEETGQSEDGHTEPLLSVVSSDLPSVTFVNRKDQWIRFTQRSTPSVEPTDEGSDAPLHPLAEKEPDAETSETEPDATETKPDVSVTRPSVSSPQPSTSSQDPSGDSSSASRASLMSEGAKGTDEGADEGAEEGSSSHPDALKISDLDKIELPDHLVCPICLELLFCPFSVKPCGHVFCEPCLRRLARPSPTNTACPLCREIIGACQPAAEYCREIRQKFPKHCAERQKFELGNSAQHLPLPWLQGYRFLNFDSGARNYRSGSYSSGSRWFYTAFWIFVVDIFAFLFILSLNWMMTQTIETSGPIPTTKSPAILDQKPNSVSDNYDPFWKYGFGLESDFNYSKLPKSNNSSPMSDLVSDYKDFFAKFKKIRDSLPKETFQRPDEEPRKPKDIEEDRQKFLERMREARRKLHDGDYSPDSDSTPSYSKDGVRWWSS